MNAWDEDDQARPPALSLSSLHCLVFVGVSVRPGSGRYLQQPWPEPGPLRD